MVLTRASHGIACIYLYDIYMYCVTYVQFLGGQSVNILKLWLQMNIPLKEQTMYVNKWFSLYGIGKHSVHQK